MISYALAQSVVRPDIDRNDEVWKGSLATFYNRVQRTYHLLIHVMKRKVYHTSIILLSNGLFRIKMFDIKPTVLTFNSCSKCLDSPRIIHDRMPDGDQVSMEWMYV